MGIPRQCSPKSLFCCVGQPSPIRRRGVVLFASPFINNGQHSFIFPNADVGQYAWVRAAGALADLQFSDDVLSGSRSFLACHPPDSTLTAIDVDSHMMRNGSATIRWTLWVLMGRRPIADFKTVPAQTHGARYSAGSQAVVRCWCGPAEDDGRYLRRAAGACPDCGPALGRAIAGRSGAAKRNLGG